MCQARKKKSQESFAAPVFVSPVNTSPQGTCRTQILTTPRTFRQRITYSPSCRKRLQDCQRNFLPRRPSSAFHVRTKCITANVLESHFAVAAPNSLASPSRPSNFPLMSYHVLLHASKHCSTNSQPMVFHELLDFRSRHRLRHEVGGVHARADILRDESFWLGGLLYP